MTKIVCELWVGQGIALQNGTGSLLMEDEVHSGQAGGGVILAENGHDGIAVFAHRRFVCSPDEQTAAACGRIYVPTDFDTIEKALSRANAAEKA